MTDGQLAGLIILAAMTAALIYAQFIVDRHVPLVDEPEDARPDMYEGLAAVAIGPLMGEIYEHLGAS